MKANRLFLALAAAGAIALGLAWPDTPAAQVKIPGTDNAAPKPPKVAPKYKAAVPKAPKVGPKYKAAVPKAPQLSCYNSPLLPYNVQKTLMSQLPPPGICLGHVSKSGK